MQKKLLPVSIKLDTVLKEINSHKILQYSPIKPDVRFYMVYNAIFKEIAVIYFNLE